MELIGYGKAEKRKRQWSDTSGVYTFGSNETGQLGFQVAEDEDDEDYIDEKPKPAMLDGLQDMVRIAAGGLHCVTMDVNGQVTPSHNDSSHDVTPSPPTRCIPGAATTTGASGRYRKRSGSLSWSLGSATRR